MGATLWYLHRPCGWHSNCEVINAIRSSEKPRDKFGRAEIWCEHAGSTPCLASGPQPSAPRETQKIEVITAANSSLSLPLSHMTASRTTQFQFWIVDPRGFFPALPLSGHVAPSVLYLTSKYSYLKQNHNRLNSCKIYVRYVWTNTSN